VRVVTIGIRGRAINLTSEPNAEYRHDLVAQEANACGGEPPELRDPLRIEDAVDSLVTRRSAADGTRAASL